MSKDSKLFGYKHGVILSNFLTLRHHVLCLPVIIYFLCCLSAHFPTALPDGQRLVDDASFNTETLPSLQYSDSKVFSLLYPARVVNAGVLHSAIT